MVRISRNRIDLENARIDRAFLNKHHQVTVGGASGASSGASYTINLSNGNVFHVVLTANCTFTFSNPYASGIAHSFTLFLGQDATGGRTVTWPNAVEWAGGTAPTITSTNQQTDIYSFLTVDGGTVWFGFVGGQDYDYGLVVAPGAPENLEVTSTGDEEVNLAWDTPNSDGGAAITGYKIYRDTSAPATTLLDTVGITTTYQDTAVTNGVTYHYRVRAVNAEGDGSYSNSVSATPMERFAMSITGHDSYGTSTNATTYTKNSCAIGTAPAAGERRFVVVCAGTVLDIGDRSIVSCQIGGVNATYLATANHLTRAIVGLFIREVSTGTTANVSVTCNGNTTGVGFTVYSLVTDSYGYQAGTSANSTARPANHSLSVTEGGIAIGLATTRNGGAWSWTGLTENYDFDFETTENFSSATYEVAATDVSYDITATTASAGNERVSLVYSILPG